MCSQHTAYRNIPLKPVLGTWEKLLFSLCLMDRLNKTESAIFISLFWFCRIFISQCSADVKYCGGRKKSPRLHLRVVILFLVLREQRLHLELNTVQAGATGQFSFLYFGLAALEGSTFTRIFCSGYHFTLPLSGTSEIHFLNIIYYKPVKYCCK